MPRKPQPKTVLLTIGLLFLGTVAFYPSIRYGYDASDSIACLLTTGEHATRYAAGYSDQAFSEIHSGMTTNEVLRILGEPLDRSTWTSWPEGDWQYSQPASTSGHYHLRTIRFSPAGKVSEAYRLFYFD